MTNTLQRLRDALTEVNPPVRELLRLAIQEIEMMDSNFQMLKYENQAIELRRMILWDIAAEQIGDNAVLEELEKRLESIYKAKEELYLADI